MEFRSLCVVSPVRTTTRITGKNGSRASISSNGPCKFFRMSLLNALSGETYRTWVSSGKYGPCLIKESIEERNAASVLPEPVGAAIKTFWPDWIFGQPSFCGGDG